MSKHVAHIASTGYYDFEIVGESHYQAALERLAGPKTEQGASVPYLAMLYLEPNNQYDPNAVRVEIEGSTVGYIPRELAPSIRAVLGELGIRSGNRVSANAIIRGGRIGQSFGVWLDIDADYDDGDDEAYDDDDDSATETPQQVSALYVAMPKQSAVSEPVAPQRESQPASRQPKRPWWKLW